MNYEYILLINSEAFYGTKEDLESRVQDHLDHGGRIEDCMIGAFQYRQSDIEEIHSYEVEITDNAYEEHSESFEVRTEIGEDLLDSFVEESEATIYIEEAYENGDYEAGKLFIRRTVEYDTLTDYDKDSKVSITIYPKPTDEKFKLSPSSMSDNEIDNERSELLTRLNDLNYESHKRDKARKEQA